MPNHIRPRRSMLYVPGDKPRALDKARGLACDGIILDLEDAVAPEAKGAARACVAEAVNAGGFGGRELILRVSAADCTEDWALAEALALGGVLIPKVESADTVRARTRHPLWCMIETPLGVLRAGDIAGAGAAGLVAGTNDLAKDLRVRPGPDRAPLLTGLSLIVLAARAHGIAALDGVHSGLDDPVGLEAACRQGAALGFDGKTLVHPGQIEAANRAFGPSAEEVMEARAIVAAWRQARAEGKGVARIGGAMVEQLHVDEALRVIATAAAIAEGHTKVTAERPAGAS